MLQPAPAYSSSLSAHAIEHPAPELEPDSERLLRLKRLQFESLARHAARLPVLIPLVAALVGFIAWNSAPAPLIVTWVVALSGVLILRWQYSTRAVLRAELNLDAALRTMVALSFCNGLIQGGGIALFFPGLNLEQKAIVTMIMVCLSAGAVSANAGYSRSFYAWAAPMFATLSLAWALQGDVTETWIALLLLLFPVAEAVFVRDNERVLRESFEIRYQNERLIRELELQRQAKSRFLASASHDLRQPLHTLALYSAALSMRKTDERTQEMAREIGNAIASLGTLLDALLDVSKLDADAVRPEPRRFPLNALVARIAGDFRALAAAKGLALELDAGEPLFVYTDEVLLERVVRNLVDNAVKYTARGAVRLRLRQEQGSAVLAVADTGPGIPAAEHERIFEEFYQLSNPERDRSRGIGLGLAIVRRLTNLLGIELNFESHPGRGTRFVLALPLAEARPASAVESSPAPEAEAIGLPEGLRVLVVDDEGTVRSSMQALLEESGCAVTLASGIDEALECLDREASELVIADQQLRSSETGVELVRRARERVPGLAALLVTGNTAAGLRAEAEALGLKLLHKPVSPLGLRRAIAAVLRREER